MSEPPVVTDQSTAVRPPRQGRAGRWMNAHPRGVDGILAAAIAFGHLWFILTSVAPVTYDAAGNVIESGTLEYISFYEAFQAPLFDISAWAGGWADAAAVALALATDLAALFLWRRRAPLRFLIATLLANAAQACLMTGGTFGTEGDVIASVIAVYAVARWLNPRTAVVAWLLAALGQLLLQARLSAPFWALDWDSLSDYQRADSSSYAYSIVFGELTIVIVGLVGVLIARRQYNEEFWAARARHLEVERDQKARLAVAEERTRIVREMHDIVSHSLAVVVSLADGAVRQVETDPGQARETMQQTADTARQAIEDMRRMFTVLREGGADDAALAPQPTSQDLLQLIATFQAADLPVTLSLDGPVPADPVLALTVHRLIQESLTNALRYATGATRVTATVSSTADSVTISVTDNGRADGRPSQGSGQGLVGMRQRVAAFDGTLEAGPTPEGGWRVHAVLKTPHPQPEGTTP